MALLEAVAKSVHMSYPRRNTRFEMWIATMEIARYTGDIGVTPSMRKIAARQMAGQKIRGERPAPSM